MIYQIISKHIWLQVVNSWVLDQSGIYFKTKLELTSSVYFVMIWTSTTKELSLCHQLWFSNPYIFAARCRRPQLFQTFNSVRSNTLNLKSKRFTSSVRKYIRIRKFELVAKNQFLRVINNISSVVVYIVYIF